MNLTFEIRNLSRHHSHSFYLQSIDNHSSCFFQGDHQVDDFFVTMRPIKAERNFGAFFLQSRGARVGVVFTENTTLFFKKYMVHLICSPAVSQYAKIWLAFR
jgi:hypothetical protein